MIRKGDVPFVTLDVQGVGYEVCCTLPLWETAREGDEALLHTYTFVREDRLELFGFGTEAERRLFCHFLSVPGIGPRTAMQLCGVSASTLARAVTEQDARVLASLKGIGKKMAEKLLLELQSLMEKGILTATPGMEGGGESGVDHDALEALAKLGYDERSMMARLRKLPKNLRTTEERVKHVLQTL